MFKKTVGVILTLVMLLAMISSVGSMGLAADNGIVYIHDYMGFSVILPLSWEKTCSIEQTETSALFRSASNEDAGYGGLLFYIEVFDEETDYPNPYRELVQVNGKYYYAAFPGDVPFDYSDAGRTKEYSDMREAVDGILKTFRVSADMPFNDVPAGEWYYNDVKAAYESGLINGATESTFAPDNDLTYAEAIKLAACMHQLYTTGSVTLKNGSAVWYQSYVDYAKEHGIIAGNYVWNESAMRYGYMEIFANALPDEAFEEINNVPDGAIPDISLNYAFADEVYRLYRAGILQGVDAERNCDPYANIKRSEVAAILTRMMNEDARISFEM